ncbi:mitochondrial phosphate carrier protein [Moesziomyces antarcticus T-34]|uniref:DnaJ homolog 1, mitochondrial n=1 Tax=Pseudozyma antarctica (strain T-34) TaxID=1151754 RepID=M9MD13_PSEA3|nr:mitochondrial phosphate carrier protein [Moesziomyces antarcticus T-34]
MHTTPARGAVARLAPLAPSSTSATSTLTTVPRRPLASHRRHDATASSSSTAAKLPSSSRSLITLSRSAVRTSSSSSRIASPVCARCGDAPRTFSSSAVHSASAKDPYSVLGVKKDADVKDIKRAYYGLAKKYHPDTNKEKGSKERFVEIQNAYDLLSDDKKRAAYDQYGTTDGQPGFDPFGGGGSSPFGAGGFGFGGAGFAGEARGEDLETTVNLTFEEACKGTKRKVVINPIERCGSCTGSGLKAGAKKSTCGTCNGTGTRTFVIQSGFQMATTCPSCGGAGSTVAPGDSCNTCDGVGRVRGRKEVEIELPAGVDDGFRIRKDGFGDVPLSGAGTPGSLYVRINVSPSRIWRRQGSTLFFPATIPFHTAVLGGKVRVPTLDGPVEVRVPAGTQVGEEMILPGRGVPSPTRRGQKGDLMVQFEVSMPRSLTKRQREILQQYADEVEDRASTASTASQGAASSKTKADNSTASAGGKESQKASSDATSNANSTASAKAASTASTASSTKQAKKSAAGRFSIHPSSRSDDTTTHGAASPPPPSPETPSGPKVEAAETHESHRGLLGRTWDWMTGRK